MTSDLRLQLRRHWYAGGIAWEWRIVSGDGAVKHREVAETYRTQAAAQLAGSEALSEFIRLQESGVDPDKWHDVEAEL